MRPKHMYVCSYSILARTSAIRIGPTQGKQDTDEILDALFPEFESSDDGIEEAPAEVEPPLPPPVPVVGVVARPAPAQDAHMENGLLYTSDAADDLHRVVLGVQPILNAIELQFTYHNHIKIITYHKSP